MKPEHVSSLVEGVSEVFCAMLNSEAKSGGMVISARAKSKTCISAHIAFLEPARGVVALWFPTGTAIKLARVLTSTRAQISHDMLVDCVAEFVGIIIARSSFRELASTPVQVGPPDTQGQDSALFDAMLEIPFESNVGPFSMQISINVLS